MAAFEERAADRRRLLERRSDWIQAAAEDAGGPDIDRQIKAANRFMSESTAGKSSTATKTSRIGLSPRRPSGPLMLTVFIGEIARAARRGLCGALTRRALAANDPKRAAQTLDSFFGEDSESWETSIKAASEKWLGAFKVFCQRDAGLASELLPLIIERSERPESLFVLAQAALAVIKRRMDPDPAAPESFAPIMIDAFARRWGELGAQEPGLSLGGEAAANLWIKGSRAGSYCQLDFNHPHARFAMAVVAFSWAIPGAWSIADPAEREAIKTALTRAPLHFCELLELALNDHGATTHPAQTELMPWLASMRASRAEAEAIERASLSSGLASEARVRPQARL